MTSDELIDNMLVRASQRDTFSGPEIVDFLLDLRAVRQDEHLRSEDPVPTLVP